MEKILLAILHLDLSLNKNKKERVMLLQKIQCRYKIYLERTAPMEHFFIPRNRSDQTIILPLADKSFFAGKLIDTLVMLYSSL
jgi:hypothetical protein